MFCYSSIKLVKHLNENLRLNLLLNLIYNVTRFDLHKERDTSLQRSYSRGDLLASLTRRSYNIPCPDLNKERDTSLQRSYSRGDLLASLARAEVTIKNKRVGVSTPVGFPLIPLQGKRFPRTANKEG